MIGIKTENYNLTNEMPLIYFLLDGKMLYILYKLGIWSCCHCQRISIESNKWARQQCYWTFCNQGMCKQLFYLNVTRENYIQTVLPINLTSFFSRTSASGKAYVIQTGKVSKHFKKSLILIIWYLPWQIRGLRGFFNPPLLRQKFTLSPGITE